VTRGSLTPRLSICRYDRRLPCPSPSSALPAGHLAVSRLARVILETNLSVVRPDAKTCLASAVVRVAITQPSVELCSAPCKARRFAPPTRVSARGLRALTAPARSSPDCNCVMATPWVSSRSQATPVSGNRSRMRSIGSEGKTSATAQPPGVNTLVHRQRPRFERGREREPACRSPRPGRGQATGARPQVVRFMPPQAASVPEPSQSSVTLPGSGVGGSNQQPEFA
jgi:hypothetical protein